MSSTLRTGLAAASAVAALAVAAVIALGLRAPTKPSRPIVPPMVVSRDLEPVPPYRTASQAPLPKPPVEVKDAPLVEASLSSTPDGRAPSVVPVAPDLPPVSRERKTPPEPVIQKGTPSEETGQKVEMKAEAKPALEPGKVVYGDYRKQAIEGFTAYVSQTAFDESEKVGGRPLEVLQEELADVVKVAPPNLLKPLRTVKVFVEWDHVEPKVPGAIAVFYAGRGEFLRLTGVLPQKAGHITILSLRRVAKERDAFAENKRRVVILHELAHAVQYYALGDDNAFIRNAYEQAMTRKLYLDVENLLGNRGRAYASTNEYEYFAELSSAYLDRCTYYPFTRDDLKTYDTVGYALMRQIWGDPERLKAKRPKGKS